MATTKRKVPKTKGKPIVRNRIENRDNYRRWPWTSFLVLGISTGSIFFMAGSPNEITEAEGVSFYLSLIFLTLGTVMLVPSVIVVLILFWYCFLNAIGTKVPERCQCLYWFAMRNKKISRSSNFYNQQTNRLSTAGSPAASPGQERPVWTVRGEIEELRTADPADVEAMVLADDVNKFNNNNEDKMEVFTEQQKKSGRATLRALASLSSQEVDNHSPLVLAVKNYKPEVDPARKAEAEASSSSRPSSPQPSRIRLSRHSFTVHSNAAFSPDEPDWSPRRVPVSGDQSDRQNSRVPVPAGDQGDRRPKRSRFRTRHVSDGWEDRLMDEEPAPNRSSRLLNQPASTRSSESRSPRQTRRSHSERDSLSNVSESYSARSDIPLVQVHPPSGDTTRTNSREGRLGYEDPYTDANLFVGRRNQRNMGSDRRNKNYTGGNRYPDSDTGHSTDRLSVSSRQGSYLSPTVPRSHKTLPQNRQNGHVPKEPKQRTMDDIVLATRTQTKGPSYTIGRRPRPRHTPDLAPVHRTRLPPGTTPDKTVFPEKITLRLKQPNKRTRKNGTVVAPPGPARRGPRGDRAPLPRDPTPSPRDHGHRNYGYAAGEEEEVEDGYSSGSSWVGVPWQSYKLPRDFRDPHEDVELSA